MHEIGHAVPDEQHGIDLLAQVQHAHQDQRQGDLPLLHARKGREHDEHEHDAAGPQQGAFGKEDKLQKAGRQRRQDDGLQQHPAAVLFLNGRAHHQQKQHVAEEVFPSRMAQHMAHQPHIGQRAGQRRAVYGKQRRRGDAAGETVQHQRRQGEEEKAQDHRGVVLQFFHGSHLFV